MQLLPSRHHKLQSSHLELTGLQVQAHLEEVEGSVPAEDSEVEDSEEELLEEEVDSVGQAVEDSEEELLARVVEVSVVGPSVEEVDSEQVVEDLEVELLVEDLAGHQDLVPSEDLRALSFP